MRNQIVEKLSLFIIGFICIPSVVHAANICTTSKYNELKEKASQIEMEWELKFDEKNNYYFEVEANKLDKDLMLIFGNMVYEPKDGHIKITTPLEGNTTYQFKFYGAYYHPCVEEYVYTKNLKIPKYNKYSQLEVCEEYSEWELCDKWYTGEIKDDEDFFNQLEEYKKKIETGEIVLEKDKKNIQTPLIIIGITAIALIGGIYYFKEIKKKKARK